MRTIMKKKLLTRNIGLRIMSILLIFAVCIPALNYGAAASGEYADFTSGSKVKLFNFNDRAAYQAVGLAYSTAHLRYGYSYSMRWNNHTQHSDIYFNVDHIKSWNDYSYLNMWIYSEKKTEADFMVLLMCPRTSAGNNYYWEKININWTGWKQFKFRLDEMKTSGVPDFSNINSFRLCAGGGWGITANPLSDLYIGELTLEKIDDSDFIGSFYKEEVIDETVLALKNGVAVYGSGSNAVTGKGVKKLGYTIGYRDKKVLVPASFFSEFFGAEVQTTADRSLITLGGRSVNCNVVTGENSVKYVVGKDAADSLGLKTVADGKLLVIGKDDSVNIFKRKGGFGVNEHAEIAEYLAYHDDTGTVIYTDSDFEAVKQNWVKTLVGNRDTNDTADADISARIQSITGAAKTVRNSLVKNGTELFASIHSVNSEDITNAYDNVLSMAMAYGCYGGELYKNASLAENIIYSLDWLAENRYNSDVKSNSSDAKWRVTGNDNWWDWDIGVPSKLVPILILTEDKLSDAQIRKYLKYFDERVPSPKMTGANYTDMAKLVLGSALLKKDASIVNRTQTQLVKSFLYADDNVRFAESLLDEDRAAYTDIKGAGFFTDGSYILHTLHPQIGTYGIVQFTFLADYTELFAGTKFEAKVPFKDHMVEMYENSFRPVIYDGKIFRWAQGRYPNADVVRVEPFCDMYKVAEEFGTEVENEVKRDIKSLGKNHYDKIIAALPIHLIKSFKALMNDTQVTGSDVRTMNKVYYNSDKVVHTRDNWAAAISMSSARIFNYESINNLNTDGWYLSDGRVEYYLKDKNTNAATDSYTSMSKYRLPGTTVDTQTRKKVTIDQGNEYLSSKKFVGGVSLGEYGVAAMDLESYHNATNYGSGNPAPAHKCDLTAKKAYFMFDDEIVCLGTDINAQNNNNAEVLTVVDNVLSKKTSYVSGQGTLGADDIYIDNVKTAVDGNDRNLGDAGWINIASQCGYVFPKENSSNAGALKCRWTKGAKSCFELWFSHGIKPVSGSYSYIMLPGQTPEGTRRYSETSAIKILRNDSEVQAVCDEELSAVGIVFWKAGTFGGITADKPCIVMCRNNKDAYEIAVSDPTQKLDEINLTVDGSFYVKSADECIISDSGTQQTVITCDTANSAGRSMKVVLYENPSSIKTKILPVASFNDGKTNEILDEYTSAEISVSDEVSSDASGRSLKWMPDNDCIAVKLDNMRIRDMGKNIKIILNIYARQSEDVQYSVKIYNSDGDMVGDNSNFSPVQGWNRVECTADTTNFMNESGQAYMLIEAGGKSNQAIYIDSIDAEVEYVTGTTKFLPWNLIIADLDKAPGTVLTEWDMQNYNGSVFQDKVFAPGSSSSFCYELEASAGNETIFYLSDYTDVDYTEYENIVFRVMAENPPQNPDRDSQKLEFLFSPYDCVKSNLTSMAYLSSVRDVPVGRWTDIRFKISDFRAGNNTNLIGSGSNRGNTINTIMLRTGYECKASNGDYDHGARIYIDSIYLEKSKTDEMNPPVPNVDEKSNVPAYLDNNNCITFTFEEPIQVSPFDLVRIYKEGSLSDEKYCVTTDNSNLKISFADALDFDTDYSIIVNSDMLRSNSGKMLREDLVLNFSTLPSSVLFEKINLNKSLSGIVASSTVKNMTYASTNFVLLIASYDNDRLVELEVIPKESKAMRNTEIQEEIKPVSGRKYRAFIWESINSMKPAASSDTLTD